MTIVAVMGNSRKSEREHGQDVAVPAISGDLVGNS